MAQGAGAAVYVDLVVRHAQVFIRAMGTTAKASFTSHRSTSPTAQPALARAFRWRPRGGGEPLGFLRVGGVADDAGQGLQPSLAAVEAHHHQGGSTVVDAGTACGGDGAVLS